MILNKNLFPILLLIWISLSGVGCSSLELPAFTKTWGGFYGPIPSEFELSGEGQALGQLAPLDYKIPFDWPVDEARLTRGFLPHARPRPHYGLDLAAPRGTPILSAQRGQVIYAGSGFTGYGRFVIIEHGGEWATFYSHLDKILVKQGQLVEKGTLIGRMGRTGRATGNHLHFEMRKDRRALDPIAFLPMAAEWVAQKSHNSSPHNIERL